MHATTHSHFPRITIGTASRWLGVEVAVKELHGTNSVQNNAEMFGEAETLNSLRHPCIIAFYGVVVNQVSGTILAHL